MRIEAVDFFYLAMPEIHDIGDGSQDALLVRVCSENGLEGWGECEAAPLVSIAAWCCPMSHSACKPVSYSVVGQAVNRPEDIRRLNAEVRRNSFDLLQADHTLSGVDMALWDLLGKHRGEPVWKLLGWQHAFGKIGYASQLFGATPAETRQKARRVSESGFRAAKFGWGSFGLDLADDEAQVRAAREGLGPDRALMIDGGTIWGEDVEAAACRLPVLQECGVLWLEEPFVSGALQAYRELGALMREPLRCAAGEGAHDPLMARNLIDFGGVGYIQVDAGRIGGISSAHAVACHAAQHDVAYVNHTFTTPLALSGSLQPYAGQKTSSFCEYPVEASALATELTLETLPVDSDGMVHLPERPGLGITPDPAAMNRYLRTVQIIVGDHCLYTTPSL